MEKLYEMLLEERERDGQRFWMIFSLMSVINGGLFAVITTQQSNPFISAVASLLGFGLCILWYQAEKRMMGWLTWWELKLIEIEPLYFATLNNEQTNAGLTPLSAEFHLLSRRRGAVTQGMSTRRVAWLMPLFFAIAWVFTFWSSLP